MTLINETNTLIQKSGSYPEKQQRSTVKKSNDPVKM